MNDQGSSSAEEGEVSWETESLQKKPSRPGSRQRRAKMNANQPANQEWSKEEENEAKSLIKEILQAGLTPNDLIKQGIRSDLVKSCCDQMGISLSSNEASSSTQITTDVPTSPSSKHKRKRRKGISKEKAVAADIFTRAKEPLANENANANTNDDSKMESLLRQKVQLERERAILSRIEKRQQQEKEQEQQQEKSSNLDPMQAMRQAALASMKRKRVMATDDLSSQRQPFNLPKKPETNSPPIDAPKGPRNSTNRYKDIDAPSDLEIVQRELQNLQEVDETDFWEIETDPHPDPRSISRRAKPLAYIDDEYRYEISPAGQVDYSAPLPSLQTVVTKSNTQIRKASPIRQNDSSHHRSSFLPNNGLYQRVSIDISDSENDDDEDVDDDQGSQLRRQTELSLLNVYKSLTAAAKSINSQENTPPLVQNQTDTKSLLQLKEREIELLKEKMKVLEQRKKVDLSLTESTANGNNGKIEQHQQNDNPAPASLSSFSAYESPFSRYPGLRAIIHDQKNDSSSKSN